MLNRIKNAPIPVPMKAPNTGMSAVNPTRTAMGAAYGIRKMVIPMKQSAPMITASKSCPVIKFENVLAVRWARDVIRAYAFSGNSAYRIRSVWLPIVSFCART